MRARRSVALLFLAALGCAGESDDAGRTAKLADGKGALRACDPFAKAQRTIPESVVAAVARTDLGVLYVVTGALHIGHQVYVAQGQRLVQRPVTGGAYGFREWTLEFGDSEALRLAIDEREVVTSMGFVHDPTPNFGDPIAGPLQPITLVSYDEVKDMVRQEATPASWLYRAAHSDELDLQFVFTLPVDTLDASREDWRVFAGPIGGVLEECQYGRRSSNDKAGVPFTCAGIDYAASLRNNVEGDENTLYVGEDRHALELDSVEVGVPAGVTFRCLDGI